MVRLLWTIHDIPQNENKRGSIPEILVRFHLILPHIHKVEAKYGLTLYLNHTLHPSFMIMRSLESRMVKQMTWRQIWNGQRVTIPWLFGHLHTSDHTLIFNDAASGTTLIVHWQHTWLFESMTTRIINQNASNQHTSPKHGRVGNGCCVEAMKLYGANNVDSSSILACVVTSWDLRSYVT